MGFAIRGIVDQSPLKKSLNFHKLFVKLFAASLPVQHQRYWCAQGLIEAFDLRSLSLFCMQYSMGLFVIALAVLGYESTVALSLEKFIS